MARTGLNNMHGALQDARFALRQMRRSPVFTAVTLLTVALAIASTAALTGVLRATLWSALPYPAANQLVDVADSNRLKPKSGGLTSVARIGALQDLNHNGEAVFSSLAFYYLNNDALGTGGPEPLPVQGAAVSGSFFNTVGSAPLLGRTLQPVDDIQNAPRTAVLSYRLWQSAFAGDPQVLGRTVRLGDASATVVGVMQPHFDLPAGSDLWYAGRIAPASFGTYRGEGSRFVRVLARLNGRETAASASVATAALAQQLAAQFPQSDAAWSFSVRTLHDALFGRYRRALGLLLAAVTLVLVIAATNLAGLQLARSVARQAEFGIRSALGITRGRLLQQLLIENVLLVGAGCALGLLLGSALLRVLASRLPPALLTVDHPHLDASAVMLSMAVTLLTGCSTALLPWLQASRGQNVLERAGSGRVVSGQPRRVGGAFVTVQVALSLLLLTVAASMVQSLYTLLRTPLGFDPARVTTFTVDLPWGSGLAARHQLYSTLEQQLTSRPGIVGVGAITALPLEGFSVRSTFDIFGQPPTPSHDAVAAEGRDLSPGYTAAMHIPLLAGRMFTADDSLPKAPPVFLVNSALARRFFPNASPIGQHLTSTAAELHLPPAAGSRVDAGEIIGVIADVQGTGGTLGGSPQPEIYRPEVGGWPHLQFAVRSALPEGAVEQIARHAVAADSTTASISHVETLTSAVAAAEAQPRLTAALLTGFGLFATLLTAVGMYGLASFTVSQRVREFALRMALGATRAEVLALLLRETARLLLTGMLAGAIAVALSHRLLAATAVGPLPISAAELVATAFGLSCVVLLAIAAPARRATHISPMEALRAD